MNAGKSQGSPEISPTGRKSPGMIESMVSKWFTRQAWVDSIEELNPKFRLIHLRGDSLKNVDWTPGDKIQIQLGGWVQRTYTPLDWDSKKGRARILVYLHAEGPGADWARSLKIGDGCLIFGPRRSIDLTRLRRPAVFFGDETSFGLARALHATEAGTDGVEFLFELSTPSQSIEALESLGLPKIHHCFRQDAEAHATELEERMIALLDSRRPVQFVFTGRSLSIQKLQQALKRQGLSTSQFQTKAYWAPGKKGLD